MENFIHEAALLLQKELTFFFSLRQRMLLLQLFLNIGNYIFKCHSTLKTAYLLAKKTLYFAF